jgi:hypothetical protein
MSIKTLVEWISSFLSHSGCREGLQGTASFAIEMERGSTRRFAFLFIGDFR